MARRQQILHSIMQFKLIFLCVFLVACASQPSLGRARSLWRKNKLAALEEARRVVRLNDGQKSIDAAKLAVEMSLASQQLPQIAEDYSHYLKTAKQHHWALLERYCLQVLKSSLDAWQEREKLAVLKVITKIASPPTVEKIVLRSLPSNSPQIREFAVRSLLESSRFSKKALFDDLSTRLREGFAAYDLDKVFAEQLPSVNKFSEQDLSAFFNLARSYVAHGQDFLLRCRALALLSKHDAESFKAFKLGEFEALVTHNVFQKAFNEPDAWQKLIELSLNRADLREQLISEKDAAVSFDGMFCNLLNHADCDELERFFSLLGTTSLPMNRQVQIHDTLIQRTDLPLSEALTKALTLILEKEQIARLKRVKEIQQSQSEFCRKIVTESSDPIVRNCALKRLLKLQPTPLKPWYQLACSRPGLRNKIIEVLAQELPATALELWIDDAFLGNQALRVLATNETYLSRQLRASNRRLQGTELANSAKLSLIRQALSQGVILTSFNSRSLIAEIALNFERQDQSIERIYAAASLLLLSRKARRGKRPAIIRR